MTGQAVILRGDALHLPIPDSTVDLVVTSPPYFGLRSYTDAGQHYAHQVGAEATPAEYVDTLIAATREMVRVLKPSGSIFVNLGDKYSGAQQQTSGRQSGEDAGSYWRRTDPRRTGIPSKSLMGLPWRYALRCIDELGLILRAELIWSKCISGGTDVYARVSGREKVIAVKDLARCVPGSVELWTGEKWSPMLRCDPTPPTEGRAASSAAARSARYRGKPIPPLAADLEIEFRNGQRVGCTPNHKWPTTRGLVRADDLTVGDVVPMTRLAAGTATPAGLDDEMTGWLVGLYIAEGSRSEDMVQIASHVRETERFDHLRTIAEAFDGTCTIHHTKGNTATANLSGKMVRAVLDTYVGGRTAVDKRLAPACWRRGDTFIRAVLDGYLSGDGGYDAKLDRWKLCFTANDGLATDLRTMCARLGYSVRLRRAVHHFDGRDFPGWGGTLYVNSARRKRPDSEVVAIRQSRARQFWNIEIADEPHQFALASGVLTCNSNGLPESVTDRVRRSHETWFHLTKQPRYFSAVDEIREPHAYPNDQGRVVGSKYEPSATASITGGVRVLNPLGKLPSSVWTIPTVPLQVPDWLGVEHFASFPPAIPKRLILGWSPSGVCTACGEGRRSVIEGGGLNDAGRALLTLRGGSASQAYMAGSGRNDAGWGLSLNMSGPERTKYRTGITIAGYACACPDPSAPTTPAVILDSFGGTGTTAMVAAALGRTGITVDMSADYCRLAAWRANDPAQQAKVRDELFRKPEAPVEGQLDMFEVETA